MNVEKLIAQLRDQMDEDFDTLIANGLWVLRGKKPGSHADISWGSVGGVAHTDGTVCLYTNKDYVEREIVDEIRKEWNRNEHLVRHRPCFDDEFELVRITKDELLSTYKKAQII